MPGTKEWIVANIDVVLIVIIALLVLAMIMFIVNTVRLNQLHKKYRMLMKGMKNANLEEILFKYAGDVQRLNDDVRNVVAAMDKQQRELELSIGPVGVLRYNAFPDAGSDLSYSIAVLNREANGVVLTSIFGREESRTYAKPIVAGASTYHLSDEEKQVLQMSIEKMKNGK